MTDQPATTVREFQVNARSTDVFGRVLCNAREHHFIVDGPAYNNCPGEELTPPELFLTAVASCGVELVHVIARETGRPVGDVSLAIKGIVDRGAQARTDLTTFTALRLSFRIGGTDRDTAASLVHGFMARCPLYGTVAAAVADVTVDIAMQDQAA